MKKTPEIEVLNMYRQTIIDFLNDEHTFLITKLLKQYWKQRCYSYRINPRPDFGLMLLLHGQIKFVSADRQLTAKAGDIVFLPKNSYYDAVFENEAEDYLINFDAAEGELDLLFPVRLLQNAPLSYSETFDTLIEEQIFGNQNSLKVKGLFYLLLDSVVSGVFAESSAESKIIEKAKALLRSDEELRISQIAHQCGICESGLRKKFKAALGISPTEYRLNFKLSRAKYLLESTDLNVGEIADALHFYDAACFCRMFKAYTGMSPMQYATRKQL